MISPASNSNLAENSDHLDPMEVVLNGWSVEEIRNSHIWPLSPQKSPYLMFFSLI
jgi:hypothetical protein